MRITNRKYCCSENVKLILGIPNNNVRKQYCDILLSLVSSH